MHNEAGELPSVFWMSSTARSIGSREIRRNILYMSLAHVEWCSGGFRL